MAEDKPLEQFPIILAWREDPAAHFVLVGRLIDLVAKVPRDPVLAPVNADPLAADQDAITLAREQGQSALGDEFRQLLELVEEQSNRLMQLFSNYKLNQPEPWKIGWPFALNPRWWGATTRHYQGRREMLEALEKLRDALRARIDWQSEASESDRGSEAGKPPSPPAPELLWNSLTLTQREILGALRQQRLRRKGLAAKLKVSEGIIKHALADLTKSKIVGRARGGGYEILRNPVGTPPEYKAIN